MTSPQRFQPIAIVSTSCLLPGALSPHALWEAVRDGRDLLSRVPAGRWGLAPEHALCAPDAPLPDRAWSDRGGYVDGFEAQWDPEGFAVSATELDGLDPLVHWLLHGAREVLRGAKPVAHERVGAVVGNLGFPTAAMAAHAAAVWHGEEGGDPRNRAMSGGSAALLARALRLGGDVFCLDAACASSLYAIKLACDRLHDGRADLMIAGAVQRADDLFLHVGFSALNALSKSGRSRPFHRDADGLVPAEGAAFVGLKRLADARRAGDTVLGIIRGIGLSNDGRGKGLLAPSEEGQERAIAAAWAMAGVDPAAASLLECHATGTPVGDATELRSSARVFARSAALPIGSLKSNLGHLITAAGAAAVIKVLGAMHARTRPPTLHVDAPHPALSGTPFRLLDRAETWPSDGPRLAGISAFGFGGNNAHLVLSEDDPALGDDTAVATAALGGPVDVAIVGIGARVAAAADRVELIAALRSGRELRDGKGEGRIDAIELDLDGLRFPPHDLAQTQAQQLAMLAATREALAETVPPPRERSAVLVGMEPDPEVARYGCRWRLPERAADADWLARARAAVVPALESAAVLGSMPNIPANRLSSQFDLGGPAFTVQAGEASGPVALGIAVRAIAAGELDVAVVGATDFACEAVQRAVSGRIAGDAAVALVVKRLDHAERDGDRIYALVGEDGTAAIGADADDASALEARIGFAPAAFGLVRVAVAAQELHQRRRSDGVPWLSATPRARRISIDGFAPTVLREAARHPSRGEVALPRLYCYAGADRAEVVAALRADRRGLDGPARVVLVANESQLAAQRLRALAHLVDGAPGGHGIHFRDRPLAGEVAFAFAGAGAAYRGMGRDLLSHLPGLGATLAARSARLPTALSWSFEDSGRPPSVMEQLTGSSALAQMHLALSEGLLGLRADAWLGYSSGETNALIAAGVWNDPDALMADMDASGLLDRELAGRFDLLERVWGTPSRWTCWTAAAPLAEVRAVLAELPRVHIAIVNSDEECLIAGDATQCAVAVERLGAARCLPLDYALVVHVPELRAVGPAWLDLHRRATSPPRHGRVYSSASGRSYATGVEACAEAILAQAVETLDVRPLVENAWNDGVRIFVEHGPGGTFGRVIRQQLRDREALVVSLDRRGKGIETILGATAALLAAGVDVDHLALERALAPARPVPTAKRPKSFAAHPPAVKLPPEPGRARHSESATSSASVQRMAPAPSLPPVLELGVVASTPPGAAQPVAARAPVATFASPVGAPATPIAAPAAATLPRPLPVGHAATLADGVRVELARLADAQRAFTRAQTEAHQRFIALRRQASDVLLRAAGTSVPMIGKDAMPVPSTAPAPPERTATAQKSTGTTALGPRPSIDSATEAREPMPKLAPRFDRKALEIHADGRISEIFGPEFAVQDGYARQVRMPKAPLLLADRVMALDAEPMSMGTGRIVTETDVGSQDWYLLQQRMPAGVMVEAGQADLMLISYLGVDRFNRGERVYRLLGCELTYHGALPKVGETLRFDIHLDGHAAQGDIRLMFFHYEAMNGDRPQLTVRQGQAGFFTDAELADSAGCLWTPEDQAIVAAPRLDPPRAVPARASFDRRALEAFAAGDTYACFGAGFERAQTHTLSPRIHDGRMLLIDRVTAFESRGGPWGRGYTRAELDIDPGQWFFDGHFKNDPCMPGTLMLDGCLQVLAFHLAAHGYTLDRDAWRFEPVPEIPYKLQCRGQVTPRSRQLVTEVFVEEIVAGPEPTVFADVLCTVDGLKAFHARRLALRLVPDWPVDVAVLPVDRDPRVVAVDGFRFDRRSLVATALGRPSDAFGPMYRRFDGPQRVARLPSPPFHFIDRILAIEGPIGVMRPGAKVVAEFDLATDAWHLAADGGRAVPYAVLLEAALQPCGWLASYVGSALTSDGELCFRNLDGSGTITTEVCAGEGPLRTEVELNRVSASGGMIILGFGVRCFVGARSAYAFDTVFGFFPPDALASQAGLPDNPLHRGLQARPANRDIDVREPRIAARLGVDRLRMIDRIDGLWDGGGGPALGYCRAVKMVDANEWFFKAHFFQDPVQPGSLGLTAMIQALQVWMLEQGMDAGIERPRFEALAAGQPHQWRYRGQVLPHHGRVHSTVEVTATGRDERGPYAVATASLWVDGQRIYEASGFGVRIVAAGD